MAVEITIPRLGWSMEEGVFVGWHKHDGDAVKPGDVLFSLEGDKAIQEVECMETGILRIPSTAPPPGTTVRVGEVLGYVTRPGEAFVSPERAAPQDAAASPRARRLAKDLGVDLARLRGSGEGGRIREEDVRAAAAAGQPAAEQGRLPITPLRRRIASRLAAGANTVIPVTLTTTADATQLVKLEQQLRAGASDPSGAAPGFTDLFVKLAAAALQQHPLLNASWTGEAIERHSGIHIGVAVDTDAGLLVPVIRDVPALSLQALAERSRDLIARARARLLGPEEMQGGTFTVTNLGAFGIDAFTPVIHPPQCAVLGVGRIAKRPVVSGDQVVPRDLVTFSLTFDHRIVDGAPAARFLKLLVTMVEKPDLP